MILEMMISGLCVFARESCRVGDARGLHILTMNHTAHEPQLIVPALYVETLAEGDDPKTFSPDHVIDVPWKVGDPAGRVQLLVWDLRGYRLDFEKPPSVGIREATRTASVMKPDYSPGAKKNIPADFSWVPELHRAADVANEKALALPGVLDPETLPGYASSRFMTLQVNPTGSNKDNWVEAVIDPEWKDKVFGFEEHYKQALADRVSLKVTTADPTMNLLLYSYATGKFEKTIRLKAAAGNKPVPVTVSNLPSSLETYVPGNPLHHFKPLYDVLRFDVDQKRVCPAEVPKMNAGAQVVKCTLCSVCGGP